MAFTRWSYKNFAKGVVLGSHSTVTTSITLNATHGARFGTEFPQMCVLWQFSSFPDPSDAAHNIPSLAELVSVTNVVGDVATVERSLEGTAGLDMTDTDQEFRLGAVNSAGQLGQLGDGTKENVFDYGALGDGVADDTVAVSAAIDAVQDGGTVYFPPTSGGYLLSTWPAAGKSISKKVRFLGSGESSACTGPLTSNFIDMLDQSSIDMEQMAFVGWDRVVEMENFADGLIELVRMHRCSGDGHYSFLSWQAPITGTPTVDSFIITENNVKNAVNRHFAVCFGNDTTGIFHNFMFSHNEIEGGTRGLHLSGDVSFPDFENYDRKRNVMISDNHIWGQGNEGTPCGIITFANRVTITGNVIHDVTSIGGTTEVWGIYTKGNYATVTGNNVYNLDRGLLPGSTAYRLKGSHRTLTGNIATQCGVAFRLEGSWNTVSDNVFEDIRLVGGETVGVDTAEEALSITGNVFRHTPERRYHDLATGSVTGGPFVVGETITGGTSGATGVLGKWNDDPGFDQNLDGGGHIIVTDVVGTFTLGGELITGGTSGATYTTVEPLNGAQIAFTVQAPISNVVVNNNIFIGHSSAFKTAANSSTGPSSFDIHNQQFCNNVVDGALSRGAAGNTCVHFNHISTDWTGRQFSNLKVCDNIFRDAGSSLLYVNPGISLTMNDFHISGNIVEDVSSLQVNLNSQTVNGFVFEEITGDQKSNFNTMKIENGEWDGPHFILGDAGAAFHIWQDGTNVRGKLGAPTSAGDGTIVF